MPVPFCPNILHRVPQIAYKSLYSRIRDLALATDIEQVQFKHDGIVYGVYELPVTW